MKKYIFILVTIMVAVITTATVAMSYNPEEDALLLDTLCDENLVRQLLKKADNHNGKKNGHSFKKLPIPMRFHGTRSEYVVRGYWKTREGDRKFYLPIGIWNCKMDVRNESYFISLIDQLFYPIRFFIELDPITKEVSFNYLRYGRELEIIEKGRGEVNNIYSVHVEITRHARYKIVIKNENISFQKVEDIVKINEMRIPRKIHFGKFFFLMENDGRKLFLPIGSVKHRYYKEIISIDHR